jgi:hypothetical protein
MSAGLLGCVARQVFFRRCWGFERLSPSFARLQATMQLNHRSARFRGPAHATSAQARNLAIEKSASWNGRDHVGARDKYKLEILGDERGRRYEEANQSDDENLFVDSWRHSRRRMSRGLCSEPRHQVGRLGHVIGWRRRIFVDPSISAHPNT